MTQINRKLLVVDDDTIVRESVVAYLEDSGFDVIEAQDGATGLALFHDQKPELVLTDLRMPGMDGLHLLAEIHESCMDVPVIVISGAGVMDDVVEALRLGAVDYLIKPLADMQVLIHAINKSLERLDLLAENKRYREQLETTNTALKDNLLTIEKDQKAGRRVQQRLLPPSPIKCKDYVFEHCVIPSLYLSGDFVDTAYKSGRYFSFYLTDVSGHGASSAFATIWMKHVAMELLADYKLYEDEGCFELEENPLFTLINERLIASNLGHYMTCFSGVIDLETGVLKYSLAGHLPMPVLLIPGEKPRFLEAKGRPLGLFPNQFWKTYEAVLPVGASLVAFSDGILELMPSKDLIEKENYLLKLLSNGVDGLDTLMETLNLKNLSEIPDDIAIFTAVRR